MPIAGAFVLVFTLELVHFTSLPFVDARLFKIRIRFGAVFDLVWLTCRWISDRVQRIDSYDVRR